MEREPRRPARPGHRPCDPAGTGQRGSYRYRIDDGLPGAEGAFLLCTCWFVINLARQGKVAEAERVLELLQQTANHLGLFSEQYDPGERRPLGNFPQAFTHLGYLAAVCAVQESKRS